MVPSLRRQTQLIQHHQEMKMVTQRITSRTKLKWRCSNGHEWVSSYNNVRAGGWCHICAGNLRKTIVDCREIAREQGGECLSETYKNNQTPLRWRCAKGHEWSAVLGSVYNNGTWCPFCNGGKKTIVDCCKVAQKRGGKCLSRTYKNDSTKMKWQCSKGHKWEAIFNSLHNGSWCPHCAGKHITIEDCKAIAKERGGKCLSRKYVKHTTHLKWQCSKGHVWGAGYSNVKHGTWCPKCGGRAKLSLQDCTKLAKKRGGTCLATKYKNCDTKIKWRCNKGHEWLATYRDINVGRWCPVCAGHKNSPNITKI
jgi:hypothetical protein